MRPCDNPFSVQAVERIRYQPQNRSIPELMAKLKELGYCAAIVGPDGSGKTTLLEDLRGYLAERGFGVEAVFVNDTTPLTSARKAELFGRLNSDTIVLLDGADHLSGGVWRRLKNEVCKNAAGLVITSHKPGMLPTWVRCGTTAELFEQIVSELLREEKRPERPQLVEIFNRYDGNIRDGLRHLYDVWANQV